LIKDVAFFPENLFYVVFTMLITVTWHFSCELKKVSILLTFLTFQSASYN